MNDEFKQFFVAQFSALADHLDAIAERFDGVDARFTSIDERLALMDRRFAVIDERFIALDARLDSLATKDGLESLAIMVQKEFASLSDSSRASAFAFSTLESRVRKLEEHASEQ